MKTIGDFIAEYPEILKCNIELLETINPYLFDYDDYCYIDLNPLYFDMLKTIEIRDLHGIEYTIKRSRFGFIVIYMGTCFADEITNLQEFLTWLEYVMFEEEGWRNINTVTKTDYKKFKQYIDKLIDGSVLA